MGVKHPAADFLQRYVEDGIPSQSGNPWLPEVLETSISKGPNASSCTPEMTYFI